MTALDIGNWTLDIGHWTMDNVQISVSGIWQKNNSNDFPSLTQPFPRPTLSFTANRCNNSIFVHSTVLQ
ncbi:MAG: hypothetical protein DYG98_21780 [Haliscomenobacteraceae bacterium CHB4]|nr:hypothetical protein [Haliscomenobacteraceae bacterium CHB4]